jgi:preprotein translocase subunit Sss1
MKKQHVSAIRIISYCLLPFGTYLSTGAIGIHALTNFLEPIVPTNPAEEVTVITVLLVLPVLVVIFLRYPSNLQALKTTPLKWQTLINKPTRKELVTALLISGGMIFIGLLPIIIIIIIAMMFFAAVG